MKEIVDRDVKITREVWDRDEAIAALQVDRRELQGRRSSTTCRPGETITVYRQGDSGRTSAAGRTCRRPRQASARPSS